MAPRDAETAALIMGAAEGVQQRHGVPVSDRHPTGAGAFRTTVETALGEAEARDRVERGRGLSDEQIADVVRIATAVFWP